MIKFKLNNFLYYISYTFLLLFFLIINLYDSWSFSSVFLYIGLMLLSILVLNNIKKVFVNNIITYILFTIVIFVLAKSKVWNIGNEEVVLITGILLFYLLKKEKFDNILKISISIKLIFIIITLIFYSFGLIGTNILSDGERYRNSLGFNHPNVLSFLLFSIFLEVIYLSRKYKASIIIIAIFIIFLVNSVTDSRTVLYAFIAFIIMYASKKYLYLFKWLLISSPIIIVVCSIMLPYLYGREPWTFKLDEILSGRLVMGQFYLNEVGVSLFGRIMENRYVVDRIYFTNTYILDSSYLRIFLQYGIVVTILITVYLVFKIFSYFKNALLLELVILLTIILYGFFESHGYNMVLLPILMVILKQNKIENNHT